MAIGIHAYVMYFLKRKGMIYAKYRIAVTGSRKMRKVEYGLGRSKCVEHYQ